ncbi:MAG: NADH-quinone oxidoreductase subunit L [Bifidobacteriaceae bacterium]|jgi:NADH-quinone oxidoreductase subunit L|nr:NADH-quinone oxidoreductase subunit L [Bifidobacteriaceae bacterium]
MTLLPAAALLAAEAARSAAAAGPGSSEVLTAIECPAIPAGAASGADLTGLTALGNVSATGGPGLAMALVIAIPLVSAAILLLAGRRSNAWGHWLGVAAPVVSFVVAFFAFLQILDRDAAGRTVDFPLFTWIPAGGEGLCLDAGLRVDPLSVSFVLLVTFVGSLIHIYSVAYMAHDADRRRFFAYLNFFVAAMELLVLADSFLLLFVGWEGVGLASYLLIGFWNQRTDYAVAAKKAFIANRIGDVGLLIAMALMFANFGTLSFAGVFAQVDGASAALLTGIGLMLLLAACGKSAQFPLQSWLGDAMAGPTPVSALIHAATMVTAGVYLVVRSGPIFAGAPDARLVVVIVGAITLLFGAIVGAAKDDMKKVLAASTMSQIGYMMLAAGLGPLGAAFAILHLITHGFFKAGLFLGAGSVMHAMADQVNIRRFGGLAGVMRITWLTFMMGWLAILGVPPFAGFWSKDKIIEAAFVGDGWQPWVFGLVTLLGAGMTAFYMSRLFFGVFQGKARWTDDVHPHESSPLMTVPMIVLAVGSVGLGWTLNALGFTRWLAPVTGDAAAHEPVLPVPVITIATLALVAAGVALAWWMYLRRPVPVLPPPGDRLVRAARNDLYQDQINHELLVRPGRALVKASAATDTYVVDGAVRGIAWVSVGIGRMLRLLQNGYVRSYAATMVAGVIVLVAIVLAVRV